LGSTTGPAPARQNLYDAAGNLTKDGTIQYNYGSNGRLSGVVVGGIATGYRYNGLGQRVAKTGAAGVAVHYVYDEAGQLLGEYDGEGQAIQETVYLGDLPVAVLKPGAATGTDQVPGSSIYYAYADHLSTPRVLTRASDNKMVWRWDGADPFAGERLAIQDGYAYFLSKDKHIRGARTLLENFDRQPAHSPQWVIEIIADEQEKPRTSNPR
jgi:YD repeat-containing protein